MTRVKPLGDAIVNNHNLVNRLLSLVMPDGTIEFGGFTDGNVFYTGGQGEKALKPSVCHLSAIIEKILNDEEFRLYVRKKDKSTKKNKICRDKLFNLDPETIGKAKFKFEVWNTFETESHPDLFIENDNQIIVIEGKRTEKDITSSTTYLPKRSQLARHIENALFYCNFRKKVIGFYIVEDTCNYIEHCTRENFRKSLELETIKKDDFLKCAIADSFYGYTTWQKISDDLKILYPND